MTETHPERPQVRIVHPGGTRRATGNARIYVDDVDITDSVARAEIVLAAGDDRPVEVKLTLSGAAVDIIGDLAEEATP